MFTLVGLLKTKEWLYQLCFQERAQHIRLLWHNLRTNRCCRGKKFTNKLYYVDIQRIISITVLRMDKIKKIHKILVPDLGICVSPLLKVLFEEPQIQMSPILSQWDAHSAIVLDVSHVHLVQDGISYVKAYACHWRQMQITYAWK